MFRSILILVSVALVLVLGYWALRKRTPADRLAALQKEVQAKGGVVFQTQLQGQPVAFLVLDCKVFLLDASGSKVKRRKVLQTGFYLGFTTCTGQSIRAEDGYVVANLQNRAVGAGGGNTSGGDYRSKDGLAWEKRTPKGWLPVEEAQA